MTGINIQAPWSFLLINGDKSVETRSYPLPKRLEGMELALIETPGKYGRFKSKIIGTITFSHSFQYPDKQSWTDDYNRHKVEENDKSYNWNGNKKKYGWVVSKFTKFENPVDPPKKRGIVYAKNCKLPVDK
jgi:predicted transcriptional regulator